MILAIRRILAALLLLVPAMLPSVPARADVGNAVTWTVDHRHQTITVAARIQIFLGPCTSVPEVSGGAEGGPGTTGRDCTATAQQIAREIQRDIESVWNGHTYRCYRLVVKVDVSVTTDRFSVAPDHLGVLIDRSVVPFRSNVQVTIGSKLQRDHWQSNDPADRMEPANSILAPSTWEHPAADRHLYAHEFGHVLGLADGYVEGTVSPKPGAPYDLMVSSAVAFIDQSTIDRVVERNRDRLVDRQGRSVALEDLVCDRRFQATLTAHEVHRDATNQLYDLTDPTCKPSAVYVETTESRQTLDVVSVPVEVNLVEDDRIGAPGYSLGPIQDLLRTLWGLTGRYQDTQIDTGLDLPITVTVDRQHSNPGAGDLPPQETVTGPCSKNERRNPPPPDCGVRTFQTWIAAFQVGGPNVVLGASRIPPYLASLGRDTSRTDGLYRNCPGPEPWPSAFAQDPDAQVTPGTLPSLEAVTKIARDWYHDHVSGWVTVKGAARLDTVRPGKLEGRSLRWTLTLCPMDKAGAVPPECP